MQSMTQTHTHSERTEVTQQQSSNNNNKEGRGTASTPESTKHTQDTHTSGDGHIAKHKK